jgi:hypothetical protein
LPTRKPAIPPSTLPLKPRVTAGARRAYAAPIAMHADAHTVKVATSKPVNGSDMGDRMSFVACRPEAPAQERHGNVTCMPLDTYGSSRSGTAA